MNAFWSYFWPCFAAGLIAGGPAGNIAFRRRSKRNTSLAVGVTVTLLLAFAWHGPFGGSARFQSAVQREMNVLLVSNEMTQVTASLQKNPLTRRALLAGRADDFQRSELVRLIDEVPGVDSASWSPKGRAVPLIAEGAAVALGGFLSGLVLAYLAELRRRYNAEWDW